MLGRICSDCNLLMKGNVALVTCVCVSAVYAPPVSFTCGACNKSFASLNELNIGHECSMSICGECRLSREPVLSSMCVESGNCSGCLGKDPARQQIYHCAKYATCHVTMHGW
jgi:hypothetical protein